MNNWQFDILLLSLLLTYRAQHLRCKWSERALYTGLLLLLGSMIYDLAWTATDVWFKVHEAYRKGVL